MKRKNMTIIGLVAGFGLTLCLGAVATQQILDRDTGVSLNQVPDAVKATIQAEANGGVINEIEMETKDGKPVYEAEVVKNGVEVDILVTADGKLLGKEAEDDSNKVGDDDVDDGEVKVSNEALPPNIGKLLGKETEDNDNKVGEDEAVEYGDHDADDGEVKVSIDALPAAVKATILKEADGRKINEIVKENEDGRDVYEAEVIVLGKEVDIRVSPDGTLLGTETDDEEDN